ncbi:ABC transporter permease [Bacillus sp. UNC438CL73TsuS30]|uniref:ABC transporter permease n=1 Tax=Bacillus sp. UNC438CL73TsuS30 TaxID=1340434 RepID=UPI00068B856A|nr:ABC transporter permease [Bacillus sp. UNC438CL73TsuS30]
MNNLESKINTENISTFNIQSLNSLFYKYGVVVAFAILIIISTILYPGFLNSANLLNMFSQLSIIGMMSIGMTFVLITGGLDMSVGGIYASSAVLIASLADRISIPIVALITLIVGFCAGLFNGLLVTKLKVPPFVATLGTGSMFTGFALVYSKAQPFFVEKESFRWLGSGFIGNIPVSVILLFLAYIIFGIILAFTTYGRSLYSIGGNHEASRLSGLRVNWLTTSAYGLSGLCAAISGIIIASRLGQGQANIGDLIIMDVIAAVVIGGTSLSGGQGAIWRTLVGGCTLIMMSNVFDSLSLSPYWQSIFKGMIIIGAVMFDYYARSKMNK